MSHDSNLYVGIDPGATGCVAVIREDGRPHSQIRGKETLTDIWQFCADVAVMAGRTGGRVFCAVEHVQAIQRPGAPRQGLSSTFKFGQSFGQVYAVAICAGFVVELVRPQKWQGFLGCRTGGDKRVTRDRAQRMFPGHKIIHANADAFLIAEYARRTMVMRGHAAGPTF